MNRRRFLGMGLGAGVVSLLPAWARKRVADVTTYTDFFVPTNIDSLGTYDVSAPLNSWVSSVPNGASSTAHSRLVFPAGGKYKMGSGGLQIGGRSHMTLVGGTTTNRCKLSSPLASGFGQLQSNIIIGHVYGGFWGQPCTDVVIQGFDLEQFHTTPGVFNTAYQGCSAVLIDTGDGITIRDVYAHGIATDGVKTGDASNVLVTGVTVADCGRNGVTVQSGDHVTVESSDFGDIGYYTLDIEPNDATSGTGSDCTYITFRNNRFGSWGPEVGVGEGFVAAGNGPFRTMSDIVIDGNTCYGAKDSGSTTPGVGGHSSLRTYIGMGQTTRLQRVTFTNNTATVSDALGSPVLNFNAIDGLTVGGNVQPLSAGQTLQGITNSTNVNAPVVPPPVVTDTQKLATAKDKARSILAITGSGKYAKACVYANDIVNL